MNTALVTGANSGIGFEAARLLGLEPSFDRIYLAVRSQAKGDAAREALARLCDCDERRFEVLVVDVSSLESTRQALDALFASQPDLAFDCVLLNAGRVGGPSLERTVDGVEISYAASLVGHHVMAVRLIDGDRLRPGATLVIAGAEAARGTMTGMKLRDVPALAEEHYNGDLVRAMVSIARGDAPGSYDARSNLATAKALAAWWTAALARRVTDRGLDIKVFAVSPGGTPGTNGPKYLPLSQRLIIGVLSPVLKLAGQAHSVPVAASRYVEVLQRPKADSGRFFASPKEKGTGPLTDNTALYAHFRDEALQEAAFESLVQLTGQPLA